MPGLPGGETLAGMQIPKPSQDDKDYFSSLVPADPDVEIKPMFGNLGAFVHGNMFAGLFGPQVGVRLRDEDRAALAAVAGSGPFGPPERPMGGYLGLPASWRDEPETAADWVTRALAYVRTFPAKERKPARKR
jgi:TfoX/Sxy family transcriptional regulator of competence genes